MSRLPHDMLLVIAANIRTPRKTLMKFYLTGKAMLKSLPEPLLTDDDVDKLRQDEKRLRNHYGKSLINHINKRLFHYNEKCYAMTRVLVYYRGCSCEYDHLNSFVKLFNTLASRKCTASTRHIKYEGESDSDEELTVELQ